MPMRLVLIASVTAGVGVRVSGARPPGAPRGTAGVTPQRRAGGRYAPSSLPRRPSSGDRPPCSTSDWAVDGIASGALLKAPRTPPLVSKVVTVRVR